MNYFKSFFNFFTSFYRYSFFFLFNYFFFYYLFSYLNSSLFFIFFRSAHNLFKKCRLFFGFVSWLFNIVYR
ncbi:MAG TPA: hypothetical protein EYG83_02045 [Sulfurospirillum arcachonense]|nr:hypothetical protein [Sulfurospirillum arcachonense]